MVDMKLSRGLPCNVNFGVYFVEEYSQHFFCGDRRGGQASEIYLQFLILDLEM